MHALRRAMVLTLALPIVAIGCENPFANGTPPDSPGVVVPGIGNLCALSSGCSAWSADSKTLYIIGGFSPSPELALLIAVDPTTLTHRDIGPIDRFTVRLVASSDGAAVYFAAHDNEPPGGWLIKRMSLSDGATTTLAKTIQYDFVVSPDGTALAYHATSPIPNADTIVVLDLPAGTRRGTTVGKLATLEAFSADGTLLSVIPGGGQTLHIWHVATGVRDTISTARANSGIVSVAWSGDNFRLLFRSFGLKAFTDTSLAGGSAVTYTAGEFAGQFQWLPDRTAIWTTSSNVICGRDDCESRRYDFSFTTAARTTSVGEATSRFDLMVSASPNGQWLAHAEDFGALYLLRQPTP